VKYGTQPKSPTQRDAADFLRATMRLLKVFKDSPPKVDAGYAHVRLGRLGRARTRHGVIEYGTYHRARRRSRLAGVEY
jgi:hypothetical protein